MSDSEAELKRQDEAAREAVRQLRQEITRADPDTLRLLVTEARTHYGWQDRDVSDETLRELYDIAKMAPTSMNQQPMRLVFAKSAAAKAKLEPTLSEGNKPKVKAAPVTAIIAHDLEFYERLPEVFPPNPKAREVYAGQDAMVAEHAFRNGTIQGAFLIIAARALGLDCGPMSGFSAAAVDDAFFAGTKIKTNFLCNIGYADESKIFRRLPRLDFDVVASIV